MLTRGANEYQHHSRRKNKTTNRDPISMFEYYSTSNTDSEHHMKSSSSEDHNIKITSNHNDEKYAERDIDKSQASYAQRRHNKNTTEKQEPSFRQGWQWRGLLHSGRHYLTDYDSDQSIRVAQTFNRLEQYDKKKEKNIKKNISSASPPIYDSSGYGEGTLGSRFGKTNKTHPISEEPTLSKHIDPLLFKGLNQDMLNDGRSRLTSNNHHILQNFGETKNYDDEKLDSPYLKSQQFSVKKSEHNNKIDRSQLNNINNGLISTAPYGVRMSNQRMNRHRRNNHNLRQELSYYTVDPYALSELFSQSEIPGFREIFSSDSYLRKFCWIVAFIIFSILSLRDGCLLWAEYDRHPITVDLRHIDSSRLPFPAVTVCNLNIVKFSALCTGDAKVNLTNLIRSDLRLKLCGTQVDDTGDTHESDIGDINNFGISSTTTVAPKQSNSTDVSTSPNSVGNTNGPGLDQNSISTSTTVLSFDLDSDSEPSLDKAQGNISNTSKSKQGVRRHKVDDIRLINRRSISQPNDIVSDHHPFGATARRVNRPGNTWSQEQYSGSLLQQQQSSIVNQDIKPVKYLNPVTSQVATKLKPALMTNMSSWNGAANSGVGQATSGSNRNGMPINNHASSNSYQSNHFQPAMTTTTTSTTTFMPPALPEEFEITERQERELQENMTNWLAVMYNRDPKLTESLGHQFGDMIYRCTMKSTNCTHPLNFHYQFTPTEGNCFTYKSRNRRKGYLQSEYEEANLAGTNHGLELVVNLEKSEYIPGSSQMGALVMIHHPGDLGYAASEAIFVAPEHTTYIGLKMMNITRLGSPYPEHCVDNWPSKFAANLTRNSTYSQQACMRICLQQTIQLRCSCQSALLPPLESDANVRTIICDTRKRATKLCVEEVMFRSADKVNTCDCRPKCKVIRYDKTVSLAKWPTFANKVIFDRGKADINWKDMAKIIVYFQTMTCEEVIQVSAFDTSKLISSLGGIMGIYVGFSFLSLFEIFEVMSRKLWHYFTIKYAHKIVR